MNSKKTNLNKNKSIEDSIIFNNMSNKEDKFNFIYKNYQNYIYWQCLQNSNYNIDDASDTFQEILSHIYKNIDKIKILSPSIIKSMVKNKLIDIHRVNSSKTKKIITNSIDNEFYLDDNNIPEDNSDTDSDIDYKKILCKLDSILNELKKQKLVSEREILFFKMRVIDGMDHKSISEELGTSIETSRSHIHKLTHLVRKTDLNSDRFIYYTN